MAESEEELKSLWLKVKEGVQRILLLTWLLRLSQRERGRWKNGWMDGWMERGKDFTDQVLNHSPDLLIPFSLVSLVFYPLFLPSLCSAGWVGKRVQIRDLFSAPLFAFPGLGSGPTVWDHGLLIPNPLTLHVSTQNFPGDPAVLAPALCKAPLSIILMAFSYYYQIHRFSL